MCRKNKIIIIRGSSKPSLAQRLTVASMQRLDIDRLIMSMIIREPQHLPADMVEDDFLDKNLFRQKVGDLVDHFENMEKEFLIVSEYGSVLTERADDIRVVEGSALSRGWIYASVKALHKNLGHQITEVDIHSKLNRILVNGMEMHYDEALNLLTSRSGLQVGS